MTYEVRDFKTNNYLFGTFTKYDEAINLVNELGEDDFDIVMVLTDLDKNILADKFTEDIRLLLRTDLRIVDVHFIEGYYPNYVFIKLLIVDKLHEPMLISYSVTIDEELNIVDYEQIKQDYLS